MAIGLLTAQIRNEKGNKVRKQGFIPGVIYGRDIDTKQVKFNLKDVSTVLRNYGERAKIKLKLDNIDQLGIIKAVDKDPVTSDILHIDIQLIKQDEKVNMTVPLQFIGREVLESKKILLQAQLSEIDVTGRADLIPEFIEIDVSNKQPGDTVTIADLPLDPGIKPAKDPGDPVAVITYAIGQEKEPEEDSSEEPALASDDLK